MSNEKLEPGCEPSTLLTDQSHSIISIVCCRFASNRTQCVHPMSKVIFVCPNTATIVKRLVHSSYVDPQYENLWLVSKQSYERCVIDTTTDTRLWLCDEPLKLKYYTVTFKRFSASKEPEFQPGKDYYFIGRSHHFKLYDKLNYAFWLVPVMTYLWPIRGEYIDDVTITSLCFFVVLNYRFHFAMSLFRSNRAQKNVEK